MMGPNGGLRDPHTLQNATKIDARKIAYLDCDQASDRAKPRGKTEYRCCRPTLEQNDCHQGDERSDVKHHPRDRPGDKMKCYHRYQANPPQAQLRG